MRTVNPCMKEAHHLPHRLQRYAKAIREYRTMMETVVFIFVRIYVPVALHGKVIGTRGTTRRELEESTESRITIPRKGQSGNIEIRSVIGVENVQRCIERIELLVADARKVAPVTHFVAVPCAKPEITQAFELFKESILNNERIPEESRNPELFTDLNKLHVTVCVLWLFDDEEIKKASDIINGCHAEIPNFVPPGSPFEVEIGGVTTWEDDPANVKVIFAEIHSEPLQRFCNLVRKRLVVAGFSPTMEKSLSTIESSVRMHMTLMKSGYADRQNPKSFDATVILDEYKDYHFGTIEVNKNVMTHSSDG
ncbi:KH domain protein [Dictyocaulus viviparus]|uniref:KH domain protein n=1 Tax=Dictyocaulus viviparus TaxID=29172 RepID=A0A0D8XVR0_DICVI|nr:KH domain protein [Dictyocaulus viviparus]